MPEFLHKIHAIEDSDGVTQEIVPLGLQNNDHTATLPTLSADATIALSSDIPIVNNGALTIQGSGTTATTFSANQSTNVTLNIKGSGSTTVTKTADNEITIGSNADGGNADTVDNMHMLDQTYAYKEKLTISEGCVASIVHTGLTESEIFALTGNRYGQLYLASDTGKYWRRSNTQTTASSSNWRNDTASATTANALPNQVTTENAIYIKLDTKTKYYSKLPKFFVEASYDNTNGSTAITGFCRQSNQFDITACRYNGNNLVGIYQKTGDTDIYYFKFSLFRSSYGASSQCSVSQTIYTNFSTNGATLTFIGVNHAEYATVSGYSYIPVPEFGEDRTAINGNLLPRQNQQQNLGTAALQWNNIYGKQIYENGVALSTKYQAALSTQTAYSAKGSATKVPQITTNNLGQVTGITEVTITDNNDNQTVKVGSTTFTVSAAVSFTGSGAASVSADNSSNTITITVPTVTDTNYYHSTGAWNGLTYTATNNGGAPDLAFTIPTGTTSGTVAAGDHTHSYLPLTGGHISTSGTDPVGTAGGWDVTPDKIRRDQANVDITQVTNGWISLNSSTNGSVGETNPGYHFTVKPDAVKVRYVSDYYDTAILTPKSLQLLYDGRYSYYDNIGFYQGGYYKRSTGYGTEVEGGSVYFPAIPSGTTATLALVSQIPTGTAASKDFTTEVVSGSTDVVTSGAVYTAINSLSDQYHTAGSWNGLSYTLTGQGGASDITITLPTGTTSGTVAAGNYGFDNVYTSDSNNSINKQIKYGSNARISLTATADEGKVTINHKDRDLYIYPSRVEIAGRDWQSHTVINFPVTQTTETFALVSQIPTGTAASKNYTTTVSSSSSDLVTSNAVKTAIDSLPKPMVFKGTLGTGGTITELPAPASGEQGNEGHTYKVITAGTYASQAAKVGDMFISNGTAWTLVPSGDEEFNDSWREIKVNGQNFLGNDITTGYVNFATGNNVTLTATDHTITISATDTTYTYATAGNYGLMSTDMYSKLDGIATGAEVNVQSDWNVSDTTSDAYIQHKPYLGQQIIVLEDNGSTTAGTWLAKTDAITALAAGQVFLYQVAVAGASTTKLNITCSGTTAGAKTIYRYSTTKLTTHYAVGEYILLCFDGTYFRVLNDYDANTDTKVRQYQKGGTSTLSGNKFPLLAKYVNTSTTTYVASYANYWNDTYLDADTGKLYVNNQEVLTSYNNQTITVGTVTFAASAAVDLVASTNITVTAATTGTGAPKITFAATDTGATSVTVSGSGNVVNSASYDAASRTITLTKGVTALTAHQGIKVLNTTNTTSQTVSASESLTGSGTVNLHRIAKTGSYEDLLNAPWYVDDNGYKAYTSYYACVQDDGEEATQAPRPTSEFPASADLDLYIYSTGFTVYDCNTDAYHRYSFPSNGGTFAMTNDIGLELLDLRHAT